MHELVGSELGNILGKVLFLGSWPIINGLYAASLGSIWPAELYIIRHESRPSPLRNGKQLCDLDIRERKSWWCRHV